MATTTRKYNYSRQREVIYRLLAGTTAHPTAEWLHLQARRELPQLSLGTVYRNLQILAEQGRVRELQFGADQTRYDAMMEPHHHFICTGCGSMTDVFLQRDLPLDRLGGIPDGAAVESMHLELFGKCSACFG